jgi:hypothetical protein
MDIKESQERILKAVKEARKMLEADTGESGAGDTGDATLGINQVGNTPLEKDKEVATLNTAQKETLPKNTDQVGLVRNKLKPTKESKKTSRSKNTALPNSSNSTSKKG